MNLSLRPEQPADEPFLRRLIAATVAAELGAESWPEPMRTHLAGIQCDARRTAVRTHFPDGASYVVLVDGGEAGWLFLARSAEEVRVAEIMLASEHRGRGVGSAVLRQVLQDAGDTPVRLWVNVMNHDAVRFYERLGFRRVGGDEVQHFLEYRAGVRC